MARKIGLRTLLSSILGGLVLMTATVTLGIIVSASGDAAISDAMDKGRQGQQVLSERLGAELKTLERVAALADDAAVQGGITSISAIIGQPETANDAPEGWSIRAGGPVYRYRNSPVVYPIDRQRVTSLIAGLLQEGVAGVFLDGGTVLARTISGGRVDEVSDEQLSAFFATPRNPDRIIDDAPSLQVVEREDDEPIFISSEPIPLSGGPGKPDLRIGWATTPSTVGAALSQIGIAALVAAGFGLLAIALAILLARRITSRITLMRDALLDIATLKLDGPPLPTMPARELQQIREALETAVQSLRTFSLFVPRELVLRLTASGTDNLRLADKRFVTVMFTDIAGFTSLASELEPEAVTGLLHEHFAMIAGIVEDEGGTIDKFTGDGVLAFWGAPEPTEDHAVRGIAAAARIVDAHEASSATFGLRVGLHSGPVIAGTVGTATRLDYTIMGDTVNIASRLEQLGRDVDPDCRCCALVSAATRDLAGGSRTLRDVGSHTLRGRNQPLDVFRLGERER